MSTRATHGNKEGYPTFKKLVLLGGPLLFFFIQYLGDGNHPDRFTVLGIGAWMIIWWIAEVVPIFITALLPMVLFPALGLFSVKETFIPYANPIIFLFMGGFVIALAMEKRKLHLRIALGLIKLTGTHPLGIIVGFMLATAFLSMWISNTATTVMMLPIALSVIQLLKEQAGESHEFKRFALALMLSIAYSANIGGTMTIIGTPPNVVFAGFFEQRYGSEIGFGEWMLIGIPVGLTLLTATYFLLTRFLIHIKIGVIEGSGELIANRWRSLGKMDKAEKLVLVVFVFTAICWSFKSQINTYLLGGPVLNNTSIAMLGALLMFCTPVSLKTGEFVLDWKSTQHLPWGILLLFGGGLSLAASLESVGIIDLVGHYVANNLKTSILVLMIGLTAVSLFATEVMSNVALVTVLLPVVMGIGDNLGADPLYLAVPVTLAASCAFMMPISTPPNAVVYSSGFIKMPQMIKVGVVLNLVAILLISLLMQVLI